MSSSFSKKILREYNLQKKNLTPGTEALVHIVKNELTAPSLLTRH